MIEGKVPDDFKPDPYADYAALLSPVFTPSRHANTLVLATNDPSDKQTDLTSPMKRIEYDLEEVNRRIDHLVDRSAEELIDQVIHIGAVGTKVDTICAAAKTLATSFDRLEKRILDPYNEAQPLYTASLNLHSTLVILRGATRYLHLSRRLALQIAETNPQKASTDPHALLRAAITISELNAQLLETPQLSVLHITQGHVNNALPQTIQRLQHQATKPATLMTGRILYTLSPGTFASQIRNAVSASSGTALLSMQRALGSGSMVRGGQTRTGGADEAKVIWTGLERAFKEVQREGRNVAILEKGLNPTSDEGEEDEIKVNLMDLAREGKEGLDGVAPTAWFWRECAAGMDKRIRDSCRTSPFLARTLKNGYARLQSMVRETVAGTREDLGEGYDGPEVVFMLQSIASIQQIR